MYRIMYITPADTHTSGIYLCIYPSGWGERVKGGRRIFTSENLIQRDIFIKKSIGREDEVQKRQMWHISNSSDISWLY